MSALWSIAVLVHVRGTVEKRGGTRSSFVPGDKSLLICESLGFKERSLVTIVTIGLKKIDDSCDLT